MLAGEFFRSYRTYEEWKRFIIPSSSVSKNSSYRTYEEWKHPPGVASRWDDFSVLTVPMRNGNSLALLPSLRMLMFLPYLWGMETWSSSPEMQTKTQFLPYLWGMETFSPHSQHHTNYLVLTVPMRNGNSNNVNSLQTDINSSYRTYEEWKLGKLTVISIFKSVLTVPMRNGNPSRFR